MRLLLVLPIILPVVASGQSVTGKWKTIDDTSGEEKSIVEILKGMAGSMEK